METNMKTRKKNFINYCLIIVVLSFTVIMMQACSGPKYVKKVDFTLIADEKANGERSVYIVIRKMNQKVFLSESYDDVANTVFAEPRDQSLLAWRILMPGQEEKIKLEIIKPDEVNIGVYGLFANPGKNWKLLLETPLESKYSIKVRESDLECKNIVNE
jgi:predicted component of type VI protein secretion system